MSLRGERERPHAHDGIDPPRVLQSRPTAPRRVCSVVLAENIARAIQTFDPKVPNASGARPNRMLRWASPTFDMTTFN